jgi:hypothetical protein
LNLSTIAIVTTADDIELELNENRFGMEALIEESS